MKYAISLAAGLLASAQPAPAPAQVPVAPLNESQRLEIDEFVAATLRAWNAPGAAISIVRDGRLILSKGYGIRDPATGAPMDSQTLFPIQSETKAFTALSALMLADDGKLNLDSPIASYLPGFRLHDPLATQVSIRDFLLHRSGLGVYSWLWLTNDELTRGGAMDRLPHLLPAAQFRSEWRYANMGYVAAAHAVERVAGVPWENYVEQRIFAPLGMSRTTFSRAEAEADPNHIGGSMIRYGQWVPVPMQSTTPLTNSTGGIFSTADDMAKWMLMHLNQGRVGATQVIKASSIAEMQRPQMVTNRPVPPPQFTSSAYGLGWFVESYRGERLIEHGGNHWGVSSAVGLLPDRKLGISVFVNQDGDLGAFMMFRLIDRFLDKADRDWTGEMLAEKKVFEAEQRDAALKRTQSRPAKSSPPHKLADYVGRYEHPGFGVVVISREGSALQAKYDDDVSRLEHWQGNVFAPAETRFGNIWAMYEGMKLQFLPDYEGKVTGLRLSVTVEGTVFKKTN